MVCMGPVSTGRHQRSSGAKIVKDGVLVSSRVVSSPVGTCLGAGLWVAEPGPLFPLPWALLPVAGSLAFLAAGDGPGGCSKAPLNRFLSMKPFPYVGKLSYPL